MWSVVTVVDHAAEFRRMRSSARTCAFLFIPSHSNNLIPVENGRPADGVNEPVFVSKFGPTNETRFWLGHW